MLFSDGGGISSRFNSVIPNRICGYKFANRNKKTDSIK